LQLLCLSLVVMRCQPLRRALGLFLRDKSTVSNVENNSWKNFYRNSMLIAILGFICSSCILLVGWNGWLNIFDDKPEAWFQRSGSMMLVTLLIADYYVYKLSSDVNDLDMIPAHAVQTKDAYRPYIKILHPMAIILTLLATIICGYGDLIFVAWS
ncbi:hypothetical protein ACQ2GG_003473, partial [Vibrio cholerae]